MTKAQGWHRADIKAALAHKGYSLKELALKYKYSKNAITICFNKPWPAVERIVAQTLEIKPQVIWPDRYDSNGNAKACTAIRNHYARNRLNSNVQSARGI